MNKVLFQLFFILGFTFNIYAQKEETALKYGYAKSDTTVSYTAIPQSEIEKYVLALKTDTDKCILGGYVTSIFHEPVEKAIIYIQFEGKIIDSLITSVGLFRTNVSSTYLGKILKLTVKNSDFHTFDTSFVWNDKITVVPDILLVPRIKILLRGRVYAGSLPQPSVNVVIMHKKEVFRTTTLDCYNDNENYWNCLFLGMFKQELVTDDPSDSLNLLFEKEGLKPLRLGMTFAEYSGEILDLRMKYSSRISQEFSNNMNLKFGFPYTMSLGDWSVGISYYRVLKISNFKRIALGVEGNIILSKVNSQVQNNVPGLNLVNSDTTYISYYLGPSALIWLLSPDRRYFATYAGFTVAYEFTQNEMGLQPFIGTRVLLDFNKALNLELRYVTYNLDVVNYAFNLYGNAYRKQTNKEYDELVLNIGIQVLF
jgi:hypothetical protein